MENSQTIDWRQVLRDNFTNINLLADFLLLSPEQRRSLAARPSFALNVPKRLAEKMEKGTLDDPLFRQFVPLAEETMPLSGFVADPVGDLQFCRTPKLLHKYSGRALLVCTSACAMHCRYCFRQNFDYDTHVKGFARELALIEADPTLSEIILSGGDPLSLPNEGLKALLDGLEAISHIRRVRFHTRFPIGIPERVDSHFLALLRGRRLAFWFVSHINHAKELDGDVAAAFGKIQETGAPVLNQTVLLQGVNDTVEALKALCEALVNIRIFPYYLHQLDKVKGAGHFEVEEATGRLLVDELRRHLPGYAVPLYVREICGEASKTPL